MLSSRQVILPGSHDKDDISLTQEAAKRAGSLEWVVIHHMLNWQLSQMAEGDQGGQQCSRMTDEGQQHVSMTSAEWHAFLMNMTRTT